MVSETRLKKEMEKRFEKYIGNCNALTVLKADGYADT